MTDTDPTQPEALTHLQQIIAGLTEGVILLDMDGGIHWANDTALTLHGVRDLRELGGTVAGYRQRFQLRWRDGQALRADEYPMQRLLGGEAFSDVVVRVVKTGGSRTHEARHWIHEIRTMVLTDPDGRPDRLVLILNDETERFNAEERFERAFGANPAPAIIARLSDLRYVKVNHGFIEMTGYQREALIGRSMHEIDVLRGAEKRELALQRLHSGATIPQMEGCLSLPDGQDKTVLLGGQPIEIGDSACMLFTFADLHPRQLALDALRQTEERFAKAFRMAPTPMAILTLEGLRFMDINAAFSTATGWRREEIVGCSLAEVEIWGHGAAGALIEQEIRHTGHIRSADVQLRAKSGIEGEFLLSAETVKINGADCVLGVMQDITERKRTETELLKAIEAVMQDTSWFGQKIVEKLANITQAKGARQPELDSLSDRAREVLGLAAQGLSDDDIAGKLKISRNTVRNHMAAIYAKVGVHRRSAVIVWARERGLGIGPKPQAPRGNLKPKLRHSKKVPAL